MALTVDLAERDRDIPGLGLVLAPDRLLDALHGQLGHAPIEDIRPGYLRYKPGMNCMARYEIRVGGRSLHAYAKAHGPDMAGKLKKAMERPAVDTAIGPGRVLLEDTGIIFSIFPNDAKLPALLRLQNENSCHRLFDRIFKSQSGWEGGEVVKVLNYKPERRHVVQVQRGDGESALCKFYTRGGFARARAVRPAPAVIGESKKHAVVAYRWKPGNSLRELASGGGLSVEHLAATARELAAFHAGEGEGLSRPDPAIEAVQMNALGEQAAFLLPQLRTRALRMVAELIGWLEARPISYGPVHGDFYDKQVIVGGGETNLIDFDGARLDDPLVDLGNYGAHLERRVISHGMPRSAADQQWQALVSAYEQVTGPVPEKQLHKYVALGLFRLIHHPFRDYEEDWQEKIELLLGRAESLFGERR